MAGLGSSSAASDAHRRRYGLDARRRDRRCSRATLSSHLCPEVSAHLLRVSESVDWVEWRDWGNPLIPEPFKVEKRFVVVPDRPGNDIEWDKQAVAKYQL
jgi:hypothetical protein